MVDIKDRPLNKPFPSKVKGKKFSVVVMKNGKRKVVNFGAKGMDDWQILELKVWTIGGRVQLLKNKENHLELELRVSNEKMVALPTRIKLVRPIGL
jgi:hypothetical protein